MKRKATIEIRVIEVVSQEFPIFLGCTLIDYNGMEHSIVEKMPILTSQDISTDKFPSVLTIECSLIQSRKDQVIIDLSHGIESTKVVSRFTVNRSIYNAS